MSEVMDRKVLAALVASGVSLLLLLVSMFLSSSSTSRLNEMERAYSEMSSVSGELKGLSARVEVLERRATASAGRGLLGVVEQVAESIGVKEKLTSQKSVPSTSTLEERAELTFEKLTLNEAANLFYRIESNPALLLVGKISMAPSFDKPELVMLDMSLSLVKAGDEK